MKGETDLTMSKLPFLLIQAKQKWLLKEHSTKVRLLPGHITWAYIHAKFEEDLLDMSADISK